MPRARYSDKELPEHCVILNRDTGVHKANSSTANKLFSTLALITKYYFSMQFKFESQLACLLPAYYHTVSSDVPLFAAPITHSHIHIYTQAHTLTHIYTQAHSHIYTHKLTHSRVYIHTSSHTYS